MFDFKAYFWNSEVYINEKFRYDSNEILTSYLNYKPPKNTDLKEIIYRLRQLKYRLLLSPNMDYDLFAGYSNTVRSAMTLLDSVNRMLRKLPPYNRISGGQLTGLDDILNGYDYFFKNGLEQSDSIDEDYVNEYGEGERDGYGNYFLRLHTFELCPLDHLNDDMTQSLRELNESVSAFIDMYIGFLTAVLQVRQIFEPFITGYLHRKETFPDSGEIAEYFNEFNRSEAINFGEIKCRMDSFGYKSLKGERTLMLCEEIRFTDIGSFLYYDFFNGLRHNFLPNQCKHCGKFFLIDGGRYYSYCGSPLPGEPGKTCRDVGARRRYSDKCKNDPVWQTYNRAYKAHYARYLKKKMTVSQFEEWSRFASELRDKTLAGEITFEQYYSDIRR